MPAIKKFRELFDERAEIMGWVVIVLASLGRYFDKMDQWPTVALVGLALVTMLGTSRYKGIHVGPGGLDVGK